MFSVFVLGALAVIYRVCGPGTRGVGTSQEGDGCMTHLQSARVLLERRAVDVVDKTSGVDSTRRVVRTGIGGARYEPIGAEAQRSEAAVMPRSARNIGLRLVHLTSFVLSSMSSSTAPRHAAVSLSALPIYALYQPRPSGLFVYTDNSTQRASYLDTRLRTVARGALHLSSIVSEPGAKTPVAFHRQLHEKRINVVVIVSLRAQKQPSARPLEFRRDQREFYNAESFSICSRPPPTVRKTFQTLAMPSQLAHVDCMECIRHDMSCITCEHSYVGYDDQSRQWWQHGVIAYG